MKSIVFILSLLSSFIVHAQSASENIIRGNQYYLQSQFDVAEAEYRKALQFDPDNEKAKFNLANALQKQQKYDEATKVLEDLASTTKDQKLKASAYYNKGVAYSKLKQIAGRKPGNQDDFLESSIEAYKKALRIDPTDQDARENLEKALLERKKQQGGGGQSKSQGGMSQKEAQQKLDMLNQKEKQLHQKKDKQNGGNGQSQDW